MSEKYLRNDKQEVYILNIQLTLLLGHSSLFSVEIKVSKLVTTLCFMKLNQLELQKRNTNNLLFIS